MVNKKIIYDYELEKLFTNMIIQTDNINRNSELFIHDNEVLKIYVDNKKMYKYNLQVLKEIIKKEKYLRSIKELVLPNSLIIYNNNIVGYSMPYIEGYTLLEIIDKKLLNDNEIKIIFNKILDLINRLKELPFNMFIGDLHEKNVIINDELNINIIDCDSYVINNKKLIKDREVIIGKYSNIYYNNKELKRINIASDYICLLSMLLNYVFKGNIDMMNPIEYIKSHAEFNNLSYLVKRLDIFNNFYLTCDDIDYIFNLKNKIIIDDNYELENEIKRIRRIK